MDQEPGRQQRPEHEVDRAEHQRESEAGEAAAAGIYRAEVTVEPDHQPQPQPGPEPVPSVSGEAPEPARSPSGAGQRQRAEAEKQAAERQAERAKEADRSREAVDVDAAVRKAREALAHVRDDRRRSGDVERRGQESAEIARRQAAEQAATRANRSPERQ